MAAMTVTSCETGEGGGAEKKSRYFAGKWNGGLDNQRLLNEDRKKNVKSGEKLRWRP
jgi:hypothetical protein